ncbi:GGDEF and EAL domain-containing protein [Lactiplantibacillus mudanjiangensis]|uniref:Signal transduction diguanylate cyclase n=1 Tax=Lactiplantibacillus mudanjiangensis TaxID=1296538 RepID=A0A660DYK9_9LACO|nr:GGDEF and EAL domain-containing protein [Lactiplantibacillus mudanjiangensis]VDG25914.1 hypothetical protein [Lactobacillus paracollinoides] [Lactiplantibacillus mudanjiangensis]VDG28861.1 hypothetical protein [Lactobacillus paracollinoides] [Lactiplantibacillus mudanjiangensis]VDG33745.1 hypothetical protein [Lactobacillus paracollinoides] [Lactiplantibacillus mudanjiangensis]
MTTQQLSLDLPVFLIRIVIVSFFSIGFIQFFQRIWNDVFDKPNPVRTTYWGKRLLLTVLTVVLGTLIHLDAMWFIHNDSAIIYHNWALFVLILPLLFDGFSKLELGIQIAALVSIWVMHHDPNLFEPAILIAFVVYILLIILLKRFRHEIMRNWWLGVLGASVLSALFWFTVPVHSMGMHVTVEWALQAVILYTLMVAFVLGYWIRQYREDQHRRRLERLADYERGVEHNSYADHQQELQTIFSTAQANESKLSFATFDLDNLKAINDRFGRLAGNAVLLGVAELMKQLLADSKVDYQLFLTSGEEYNVIFPGRSAHDVLPIVSACWQGIRKSEFAYEDRFITVTTSVGVTEVRQDDTTINSLYKRADDALLKSKQAGKDTITIDGEIVVENRHEKDLSEYCYFSQGVYDVQDDQLPMYYHELLLRTYDATQKRWILPDYFEIPVWMQITLLKELMAHTSIQRFNLNLTAAQFNDIEVAQALTQFANSSEGPEQLSIEITDLKDSQTTRRISALYRSVNMKILIDDVGSDNSFELVSGALPYVNGIKFAMQNLRQSTSEDELAERVAFWFKIAQKNQLNFILEGVETEAELAMAKSLGIPYVQGYFFGKPAPVKS